MDSDKCIVCGKDKNLVNPFKVAIFDPFVCSIACLQKKLDEEGMTIKSGDGTSLEVKPGDVQVELKNELIGNEESSVEISMEILEKNNEGDSGIKT